MSSSRNPKRGFLAALVLLAFSACSHLPVLRPVDAGTEPSLLRQRCAAVFPTVTQRLVHRIQAHLPMDHHSAMLGVSQVDPEKRSLHAVLLSIEGLTLLDAERSSAGDRIHRAIGPFEDPDFASGLLDDVALLLIEPAGQVQLGLLTDRLVCRYRNPSGVVDVEPSGRIRRYDKAGNLLRSIHLKGEHAHLQTPGAGGYELWLHLQRKETLDAD